MKSILLKRKRKYSLVGSSKLSLQEKKTKKVSRAVGVGWTRKDKGERWPRRCMEGLTADKENDSDPKYTR